MSDRRQTPRKAAAIPCVLELDGRTIPGTLLNLSAEGALFRLGSAESPSLANEDLGSDASFVLRAVKPARRYTGEMIRRYYLNGSEYVALRFWTRYQVL